MSSFLTLLKPSTKLRMDCLLPAGLPRSGKLPVLNLLTGKKSGFSPAGVTCCTDSSQTLQGRREPGSAWLCKISPQSPQGVGMRPKKCQKFPPFGKGTTPLTDFSKIFRGFYMPIYPTLVSQI